jgi:hypothetical protein
LISGAARIAIRPFHDRISLGLHDRSNDKALWRGANEGERITRHEGKNRPAGRRQQMGVAWFHHRQRFHPITARLTRSGDEDLIGSLDVA